jgi:hypothetical protein
MADPEVRAQVVPVAPVLRRGLVRAAIAAGFTIVDSVADADVTLGVGRAGGEETTGRAGVDMVVSRGEVVLRVHRAFDAHLSSMLRVLVAELLDQPADGVSVS